MCRFRLGQKVVCINDSADDFSGSTAKILDRSSFPLIKGEIYTVSEILYHEKSSHYAIMVAEIPKREPFLVAYEDSYYYVSDGGYHQDRFRPLKETKIDIFLGMLNPSDETIREFQEEDEHV